MHNSIDGSFLIIFYLKVLTLARDEGVRKEIFLQDKLIKLNDSVSLLSRKFIGNAEEILFCSKFKALKPKGITNDS